MDAATDVIMGEVEVEGLGCAQSDDGQADIDITTRCVRVRTDLVCGLDQFLRGRTVDAGQLYA
jgi:hypothetical protein